MINVQEVAYLGPVGTFSQEAAKILAESGKCQITPQKDIRGVIEKVLENSDIIGIVPIENSVQGEVTMTMDSLVFNYSDIFIIGEVVIPVTFFSFRRSGTDLTGIHTIISHPHALAQCSEYIRNASVSTKTSSSTAEACRIVSESDDNGLIAVASEGAGNEYNLSNVASNIEDYKGAVTKFYVIGHHLPDVTNSDKTVIAAIPHKEGKGTLLELIGSVSHRGLDVFSIHSRPLRSALGKYCFVISFEGHLKNEKIISLLNEMVSCKTTVKILGSFPIWPGEIPIAPFANIPGSIEDLEALNKFIENT